MVKVHSDTIEMRLVGGDGYRCRLTSNHLVAISNDIAKQKAEQQESLADTNTVEQDKPEDEQQAMGTHKKKRCMNHCLGITGKACIRSVCSLCMEQHKW